MSEFSIHPETRIGPVALTVSDLDRSVRFYTQVIGLRLLSREGNQALLGAEEGRPLLALTGDPAATNKPRRSTGLYHLAILLPSRLDLARWVKHMALNSYHLEGAADHGVSEAFYLADPDDNGIEVYRDRPREEWQRRDGQIVMGTDPLDLDDLLGVLPLDDEEWNGMPPGTRIGHVHLQVGDVGRAVAFYGNALGMDLMARMGPSAGFLSAGGYHHHIGVNTWSGVGAPPPPAGSVGLREFTIELPDAAELERVANHLQESGVAIERQPDGIRLRDPSENHIRLISQPQELLAK